MNSEILSFAGVGSSELIDQMYHLLFLEHIAQCAACVYIQHLQPSFLYFIC